MPGARYQQQLLGFAGEAVGFVAELAGVGVLAGDEQHRPRCDGLDVVERIEVHELDVAGQGRVGGQLRRGTWRGELAARGAVELEELALDRMGVFVQLMHVPLV